MSLLDVYGGIKYLDQRSGMSDIVCGASNSTLWLYRHISSDGSDRIESCEKPITPSQDDPFLPSELIQEFDDFLPIDRNGAELLHEADAIALGCMSAMQKKAVFGEIEGDIREILTARFDLEVDTGLYAYVSWNELDLIGGYLEKIDRQQPTGLMKLCVNTSKVVPFSPQSVGLEFGPNKGWFRRIEN